MAFTPATLALSVDTIGGGSLRVHFYVTSDAQATVTATDYFADVASHGVREGDFIIVKSSSDTYLAEVTAIDAAGNATIAVEADTGPAGPTGATGLTGLTGLTGESGESMARRLLGGQPGFAGDAIHDDSYSSGGTNTTAGVVFARDGISMAGTDADGHIERKETDVPVFPARDAFTGASRGIRIGKQRQNELSHSQNLLHPDWMGLNGLTVEAAAGVTDPLGTETAWLLTDTNAIDEVSGDVEAAFSILQIFLLNDVVDEEWLTFGAWFKQPDANASPVLQMKGLFFGGSVPSPVGNLVMDMDNLSPAQVAQSGSPAPVISRVQRYANGWVLGWIAVKNSDLGHDSAKWYLLVDSTSKAASTAVLIWEPFIVRGKGYSGFRPLADAPALPTLTEAMWNTFAGTTNIGSAAGNLVVQNMAAANWIKSDVTATLRAAEGIRGLDAYRIADTDNADFGFTYDETAGASVTAGDHVRAAYFINRVTASDDTVQLRPTVQGGATHQARITIDVQARKVLEIDLSQYNTASQVGIDPPLIEVRPTEDADIDLWIVQVEAVTGASSFRPYIYPSFSDDANTGFVDVSGVVVLKSASATDLWTFGTLPELDGDHVTIPFAGHGWSNQTYTFGVDFNDIMPPIAGSNNRAYLLTLHKGTANGRIDLGIDTHDDDAGTYKAVARMVSDDGTTETITYTGEDDEGIELAAARWGPMVSEDTWGIMRDEQLLVTGSSSVVIERPSDLTHATIGGSYDDAVNNQPDTELARWFAATGQALSANVFDLRGRSAGASRSFSDAELASIVLATTTAATVYKARDRGIEFWKASDFRKAIAAHDVTQSFGNGGYQSLPYTIASWLNAKGWGNWAQMFFGSVRGSTITGTEFVEVTDYADTARTAGFNRLEATFDLEGDVKTQAETEAYDFSTNTAGESPIVAFGWEYGRLIRQDEPGVDHVMVGLAAGSRGESSIAVLAGIDPAEFGADSDAWMRGDDALREIRARALSDGYAANDVGQQVAVILHGEAVRDLPVDDIIDGNIATAAGIGYNNAFDNIDRRNVTVFGVSEDKKVLKVCSVPSMHWVGKDMAPARVYARLQRERSDTAIFAATYLVQNSGANNFEHPLTVLGEILLALHAAECAHTIAELGQNFFIPEPMLATPAVPGDNLDLGGYWIVGTKEIVIPIMAMTYPLIWKKTGLYSSTGYGWVEDYGFAVYLGGSTYGIDEIDIVDGTAVRIRLKSRPSEAPIVEYAGPRSTGRGNLYDSREPFTHWDYRFHAYDKAERVPLDLDPDSPTYNQPIIEVGDPLPGNRPCIPFRLQTVPWEGQP